MTDQTAVTTPSIVYIESAGTALVLEPRPDGSGLPEVVHWGAVLPGGATTYAALAEATTAPAPPSALDEPWPLTLLPGEADGWSGTPGWAGHRGGGSGAVRWT
ncbi:MAG: alpha-galactosidase, partial [Dermatophilaceae bacterium]|nr:alpha-galactosidase [Dermatophilaceae bacterium]